MARWSSVLFLFVLACAGSPVTYTTGGDDVSADPGRTYRYSFDAAAMGSPPSELIPILGDWAVAADPAAPSGPLVVRQSGAYASGDFPRAVLRDLAFEDQKISVRCRPESGSTDQACGLMFRFVDSDNYALVRANALEGNVRLYRVVDGSRQQLQSGDAAVSSGQWHRLEVDAHGDAIVVRFDAATVIEANEATDPRGKVGLWTKADSVTAFDDLEITAD